MEQFFTKLKRGMVFLLSWISAILLVAMSFLVIYPLCVKQSQRFYRRDCPVSADMDRLHGRGLWVLHQTAYGSSFAP